jgi:hypothetical protein
MGVPLQPTVRLIRVSHTLPRLTHLAVRLATHTVLIQSQTSLTFSSVPSIGKLTCALQWSA